MTRGTPTCRECRRPTTTMQRRVGREGTDWAQWGQATSRHATTRHPCRSLPAPGASISLALHNSLPPCLPFHACSAGAPWRLAITWTSCSTRRTRRWRRPAPQSGERAAAAAVAAAATELLAHCAMVVAAERPLPILRCTGCCGCASSPPQAGSTGGMLALQGSRIARCPALAGRSLPQAGGVAVKRSRMRSLPR